MKERQAKKFSVLIFGEGGKEKKFLSYLTQDLKFRDYYAKDWSITVDNGKGSSPKSILEECRKRSNRIGRKYDLVICVLDRDQVKYGCKKWEQETKKIEDEFCDIKIIWQKENLEDELVKVLKVDLSKHRINRLALKNIKQFINKYHWDSLIKLIKDFKKE